MKFKKNILPIFIILIILISMFTLVMGSELKDGMENTDKTDYELMEIEDYPIDEAFSKENLDGVNVSEYTLRVFSRDIEKASMMGLDIADVNIIYVDEDLKVIPDAWVFACSSDLKLMIYSILSSNESDDLLQYLKDFEQKYPTKYVKAGHVTFITVENKDAMLSELSQEDIQMFRKIADAVLDGRENYLEKRDGMEENNSSAANKWSLEYIRNYITNILDRVNLSNYKR